MEAIMRTRRVPSTIGSVAVFIVATTMAYIFVIYRDGLVGYQWLFLVAFSVVAVVSGAWLLWVVILRRISAEPYQSALICGAFSFLLLLILATPKTYRQGHAGSTVTKVVPIWADPDAPRWLEFVSLNMSVLAAELLGAIAVGVLVWAVMRSIRQRL